MFNTVTIFSNLIPLAGLAWFGWSALDLLVMYWFENWMVMLFTLCSVAVLHRRGAARIAPRKVSNVYAFYGMAGLMSGLFLFFAAPLFFGVPYDFWREPHLIWGAVGLSVSHVFAFLDDILIRHGSKPKSPGAVVNRAMDRIPAFVFGMVVAVFGFAAVGSPLAGFVVLVVLKTAFEISAHRTPVPRSPAAAG
jgi:hypothetical protein